MALHQDLGWNCSQASGGFGCFIVCFGFFLSLHFEKCCWSRGGLRHVRVYQMQVHVSQGETVSLLACKGKKKRFGTSLVLKTTVWRIIQSTFYMNIHE